MGPPLFPGAEGFSHESFVSGWLCPYCQLMESNGLLILPCPPWNRIPQSFSRCPRLETTTLDGNTLFVCGCGGYPRSLSTPLSLPSDCFAHPASPLLVVSKSKKTTKASAGIELVEGMGLRVTPSYEVTEEIESYSVLHASTPSCKRASSSATPDSTAVPPATKKAKGDCRWHYRWSKLIPVQSLVSLFLYLLLINSLFFAYSYHLVILAYPLVALCPILYP